MNRCNNHFVLNSYTPKDRPMKRNTLSVIGGACIVIAALTVIAWSLGTVIHHIAEALL